MSEVIVTSSHILLVKTIDSRQKLSELLLISPKIAPKTNFIQKPRKRDTQTNQLTFHPNCRSDMIQEYHTLDGYGAVRRCSRKVPDFVQRQAI